MLITDCGVVVLYLRFQGLQAHLLHVAAPWSTLIDTMIVTRGQICRLLLQHVTRYFIFSTVHKISLRLWACVEVTRSSSNCLFMCALVCIHKQMLDISGKVLMKTPLQHVGVCSNIQLSRAYASIASCNIKLEVDRLRWLSWETTSSFAHCVLWEISRHLFINT